MKSNSKYLIFTTRIVFGLMFLVSGVTKLTSGFSASGYLQDVSYGPMKSFYLLLAGNPLVDFLVVYGEIAIGIALILGLFLWFTAYSGSLMMIMYYFSTFPPKTGLINFQLIYIFLFFLLATLHAGEFWGLGKWRRSKFGSL